MTKRAADSQRLVRNSTNGNSWQAMQTWKEAMPENSINHNQISGQGKCRHLLRRAPFNQIRSLVAEAFDISVSDILSDRRIPSIVTARHTCFVLGRCLTALPYDHIGRLMGGCHHTTVGGAVERLDWLRVALENELRHVDSEDCGRNVAHWVNRACDLVKQRSNQSKPKHLKVVNG